VQSGRLTDDGGDSDAICPARVPPGHTRPGPVICAAKTRPNQLATVGERTSPPARPRGLTVSLPPHRQRPQTPFPILARPGRSLFIPPPPTASQEALQGARDPISPPATAPPPLRTKDTPPPTDLPPPYSAVCLHQSRLLCLKALVSLADFPFFSRPCSEPAPPAARSLVDPSFVIFGTIVEHFEIETPSWQITVVSRAGSMRGLRNMDSPQARGMPPSQISSGPIPPWQAVHKQ
jgi:hypothetical protein